MEYYTFNDETGKIIDHTGKSVDDLKEVQLSLFDFSSTKEFSEQVKKVFEDPIKNTSITQSKPPDDNLDELYSKEYVDPDTGEVIREPYGNR